MSSERWASRNWTGVVVAILGLALLGSRGGYAAQENQQPAAAADEAAKAKPPKRPPIYDEAAVASDQIQAALVKASKENRRVLIQWGGNWCGWCYRLHDIMKDDPEIARTLRYEYDVVAIDIGHLDKNQDLLTKYDVDLKKHGVPFLTVLDGQGAVIVNQETSSLEKDDMENPGHNREAVLKFLQTHQAEPQVASQVLAAGMERARQENKLVFLHFGAPWCGWCHRLEAWLQKPEVEAVLSPVFVDVKVDTDRMTGGQELYDARCKKPEGIPWIEFIDPQTESALVNSTGPRGNTGFPFEDFEIDHFCEMLQKCSGRLTAEQIASLRQSLLDTREALKARPAQSAARPASESP